MSKLTTKQRNHMKSSTFVFPGTRRYPIPDESHARNALARVSQHGSSSEKVRVRRAVHKKFPGIEQSNESHMAFNSKAIEATRERGRQIMKDAANDSRFIEGNFSVPLDGKHNAKGEKTK